MLRWINQFLDSEPGFLEVVVEVGLLLLLVMWIVRPG